MRRQFFQPQPSQDGGLQEQMPAWNDWLPPDNLTAQSQEAAPTRPAMPARGLLSGWKATNNNGNFPQAELYSVADHDTVIQQAVQRPITGPIYNPEDFSTHQQGYFQGLVSPHQSGITSGASFYADVQTRQTPEHLATPFQGEQGNNGWQTVASAAPLVQASPVIQPLPRADLWQQGPNTYQPVQQPPVPRPSQPPPSMQPPRQPQQPKSPGSGRKNKKRKFPIWARVALATFLVLLVLSGTGLVYYQVNFASHVSNITGQAAATIKIKGKAVDGDSASQSSVSTSANIGTQRINILLLGSDNDQKFSSPLAQTDIVVTIDPQTKYVGMLSIPRDFWLSVPNFGPHKLDEAFGLGWAYVHDGPTQISNAAGLSIATIENVFGIPINHYAWVGLDGFIKVIDTAQGVDIDATHPMTDDIYPNDIHSQDAYGYKRLYIAPGPQHMNGIQALEYVRTRHSDLVGDFGRSARQQQVLSQLKTKLDNPSIISALPELAKDLDGYVKTDMDLPTIVNLMSFAKNLDPNKIDRLVLSPPYSSSFTTPGGADAYKANCSLIIPKVAAMFALGNNARCNTQVDVQNNTTPVVASTGPATPTTAIVPTNNSLQTLGQAAQVSALSLGKGNNDLFGVCSLLDLMFMVTFESFSAAQV